MIHHVYGIGFRNVRQSLINSTYLKSSGLIFFYLSNTMRSIHCLEVFHWIPIMFNKYHGISSSQVKAQSTNMSSKQQHVYGWVIVKPVN